MRGDLTRMSPLLVVAQLVCKARKFLAGGNCDDQLASMVTGRGDVALEKSETLHCLM